MTDIEKAFTELENTALRIKADHDRMLLMLEHLVESRFGYAAWPTEDEIRLLIREVRSAQKD